MRVFAIFHRFLQKTKMRCLYITATGLLVFSACSDDEFTSLPSHTLLFSTDTVSMDTVFSKVPTAARTFWVYNRSGKGIRLANVRLQRGNQTGFRVNVDGIELGASQGFQAGNIEVENKDSLRVFVELTSSSNNADTPQKIEDELIFTLESGVEQRVVLRAWSWDAEMLTDLKVVNDTVIDSSRPIIVYGGITVAENATLNIEEGTTLYFHDKAGIDVYGRLICRGAAENNIVLRGDRIDRMFDYLPYDGLSGTWRGLRFYESSYENELDFVDVHSACDAIVCDSSDVARLTLTLKNSIVHNSQGYGLKSVHSTINIVNSQITNALNDCVGIFGGVARINNSTIAQFYPFDSNRGAALRFTNFYGEDNLPLYSFECCNTIVTGYAEDVVMGESRDSTVAYQYKFDHCLLRTPEMEADSIRLNSIIWENVEDTAVAGERNFYNIDIDLLRYDFRLRNKSVAIGKANKQSATEFDRLGVRRDDEPDIGCYEFIDSSDNEQNNNSQKIWKRK